MNEMTLEDRAATEAFRDDISDAFGIVWDLALDAKKEGRVTDMERHMDEMGALLHEGREVEESLKSGILPF